MDPAASERTVRLLGAAAAERLAAARVLVFGLGGVGSWCVEALARSGVGTIGLLDFDVVSPSNLNRQLGALRSTLGRRKTDVLRERVLDVNPDAKVETFDFKYGEDTADRVDLAAWDAAVDAIDIVSAKILLVLRAREAGVRLYSATGGGNKFDASRFALADLFETNRDPLAKVLRKKLRPLGVRKLRVAASDEEPREPFAAPEDAGARHVPAGTVPWVVGTEGLLLAQAVVLDLAGPPAAPFACQARAARLEAARAGEG